MSDIKVPELDLIVDSKDKKYYIEKPDPNFSPQRNMAIVYETLEEGEKFFASLNDERKQDRDDRVDVLASYWKYRTEKGTKDFESYAGRALYKRLLGERILSKYRTLSTIDKLRGRTGVLS